LRQFAKTNPAADEVAGLAGSQEENRAGRDLAVRSDSRTNVGSRMVNPAQISAGEGQIMPLSGLQR